MVTELLLVLVYLWAGFTAGYYFRKWLDGAYLPRFRAERQDRTGPPGIRPGGGSAGAAKGTTEELVDWIDERNRVIESLPRSEIRLRNLLHRVTATFVFHPDGRIFVHRRTDTKDVYPGLYDMCVGGTVAAGERFTVNAYRELQEELGISGVPLYALFEHRYRDDASNSLARVFACLYDGAFRLQQEEIASGDWSDERRVDELIASGNMCPDSVARWNRYRETVARGRPFPEVATHLEPLPLALPLPVPANDPEVI